MRRILYKLEHVKPLQLGMSSAEKLWLDSISLEDLVRYFRAVNKKRRKAGCSSQYLGVYRRPKGQDRPWRAMLLRTVDKQTRLLWSQNFADEDTAARARDQAVLQHGGRCYAGSCLESLPTAILVDSACQNFIEVVA